VSGDSGGGDEDSTIVGWSLTNAGTGDGGGIILDSEGEDDAAELVAEVDLLSLDKPK